MKTREFEERHSSACKRMAKIFFVLEAEIILLSVKIAITPLLEKITNARDAVNTSVRGLTSLKSQQAEKVGLSLFDVACQRLEILESAIYEVYKYLPSVAEEEKDGNEVRRSVGR